MREEKIGQVQWIMGGENERKKNTMNENDNWQITCLW